jgi:hypothetical protein
MHSVIVALRDTFCKLLLTEIDSGCLLVGPCGGQELDVVPAILCQITVFLLQDTTRGLEKGILPPSDLQEA